MYNRWPKYGKDGKRLPDPVDTIMMWMLVFMVVGFVILGIISE